MAKLNALQKCELDLLKEVLNICELHNISYVILGGTMLGAVRHGGFIPWDDDIDIGMPRSDYEKFLKVFDSFNYENIKLQNYKNQKDGDIKTYPIQIVDTSFKIKVNTGTRYFDVNAWIDVFPLDGMPKNRMIFMIHRFRLLLNRCFLKLAQFDQVVKNMKNRLWYEKIIIKFALYFPFIKNIWDERQCFDKIDYLLKKYRFEDSEYVVNFMGAYKFREMFPKKIYCENTLYKFEDMMLYGPRDFDTYLSQMYGDYMKLPKEEDRNKHCIE